MSTIKQEQVTRHEYEKVSKTHEKYNKIKFTFTSMSPILLTARMMGRPTMEGKIWAGKLDPA
jgi:hypothetical protein